MWLLARFQYLTFAYMAIATSCRHMYVFIDNYNVAIHISEVAIWISIRQITFTKHINYNIHSYSIICTLEYPYSLILLATYYSYYTISTISLI